jgi:hypothetical protein
MSTPLEQQDGGLDGGRAAADAASEPDDASGGSDSGSDSATAQSEDAGTDASSVTDDGGGSDDADAADATDAADSAESADASIPCDESATCANPINLGTIWGGVIGGVNEQAATEGNRSDWYLVEIYEYQGAVSSDGGVHVGITIAPPAGLEFDLEVYLSTAPNYPGTCTQVAGSSSDAGAGQQQTVNFSFPDTEDEVLGWVTIHVIAKPGSRCTNNPNATYWLDLTAE